MHAIAAIVELAAIEGGTGLVVVGAIALALLTALAFALTRRGGGGSAYDRIGAGGIPRADEHGPPAPAGSRAARSEREREIRQMLGARSERLVRQGGEPLDVEAELSRLLASEGAPPARDAALVAEVRQLVTARNERRLRQGRQPLDVEAEIARTLDELEP